MTNSGFNLASVLRRHAQKHPNREALRWQTGRFLASWRSLDYEELDRQSDRLAWGLQASGVASGDRVLVMIRPGPNLLKTVFALFKLTATPVFIDPGMGVDRMARCVEEVSPQAMIGIPQAHLLRYLFPHQFRTIRKAFWSAETPTPGPSLKRLVKRAPSSPFPFRPVPDNLPAAIFFTSGSTGVPKGVCYGHRQMNAQADTLRHLYSVKSDEIDMPTFPLFVLFSIHFGITAVIPPMDPAHPGKADPRRIVDTIQRHQVTHSFGSPALWKRVARYCHYHHIRLPSLKRILIAGAPVPWHLVEQLKQLLPNGEVFTPYGATEALPVTSISGHEILTETADKTREGKGICVGRPAPRMTVRIIHIEDKPLATWKEARALPTGAIGDIVVKGPCVSLGYWNRPSESRFAKIPDRDASWHRIGDAGYFDEQGRLWYCGRTRHRVETPEGCYYSIMVEEIFNALDGVERTALVGVETPEGTRAVLCVELEQGQSLAVLTDRLRETARRHHLPLRDFLFHPGFPVDRRHNAKIEREALARWASEQLSI